MKKLLRFEIKHNLRRASRVYVKSTDSKVLYGSFHMDKPDSFEGWDKLSIKQTIELKQFMQNINAVYKHLHPALPLTLIDFRFRLPYEFIETLDQISIICHQHNVDFNIFDPMIKSITRQITVAVSKLTGQSKKQATDILDKSCF